MCVAKRHVRFGLKNRHVPCTSRCPVRANSGHGGNDSDLFVVTARQSDLSAGIASQPLTTVSSFSTKVEEQCHRTVANRTLSSLTIHFSLVNFDGGISCNLGTGVIRATDLSQVRCGYALSVDRTRTATR